MHTSTVIEQEVNELICSVLHQIHNKTMNILVNRAKEEERVRIPSEEKYIVEVIDNDFPTEDISVSENNYKALMSASPSWSPNKPANVYSEEDLWIVIDAQREGFDLAIGSQA